MSLANKHIVITRPTHQARKIKQLLEDSQANVTLFPTIEIQKNTNCDLSHAKIFDWFIFISPNAVEYGIKQLAVHAEFDFSTKIIAAIGKKTAEKLKQCGVTTHIVPQDGFNTESFLALAKTQSVNNKRILIFRGNGGRELLASTLRERGAIVGYAEVYRRICPLHDTLALKLQWQYQLLDIIVITSSEGLYNLYSMVKEDWIKQVPLLLSSQRMVTAAMDLGHKKKSILATNPSDEAVFSRLYDWAKQESTE